MHTSCALRSGSNSEINHSRSDVVLGRLKKFRKNVQNVFMISATNPFSAKYFRSEISIRKEKERQLNSKHPWVIHPLSKFRAWYEVFLILVHFMNLLSKPLDAGFAKEKPLYYGHRAFSTTLDVLCWIDICMNFRTGFIREHWRQVEMDPKKIARNYVLGPFFILDLLSSFPRNIPYSIWKKPADPLLGAINVLLSLRFARMTTLLNLIFRLSQYFEMNRSKTRVFVICATCSITMTIHWLACIQFMIPRLVRRYFAPKEQAVGWIFQNGLYEKPVQIQYLHAFFKVSAEILGMRLQIYELKTIEDYIVSIFTYVVGKIIMVSIWIILAFTILKTRSMISKFEEIINQLDEYMKQKQLPLNLRDKISQYYEFKYQKKYFKEGNMTELLSGHLKEEVNIQVCRSLISKVSLFTDLTTDQVRLLVARLIPEIFLPKDTIIQSGSPSKSMYFLSSGTVAVYTHSGKEVCHLQDGDYFGEICLVLKNQLSVTSVVSIEFTQVYKLRKEDFERVLMKNKKVFSKIVIQAEARLKTIHQCEELYKRQLFEKNFQKSEN